MLAIHMHILQYHGLCVCLSVGHTDVLCKNGSIYHDDIWDTANTTRNFCRGVENIPQIFHHDSNWQTRVQPRHYVFNEVHMAPPGKYN